MAFTIYDFTKGIDFTALGSASAGDHNNLVDAATTVLDSSVEGKGIVLWSVDSALNTPVVPNASVTVKWKRYIWVRVPFAGATDKAPKYYAWNDDATNDATYLKWQRVKSDTTAIEADIAAIEADITAMQVDITAAVTTANIASTNASTAVTTATASQATANTADVNATQALADAADAAAAAAAADQKATDAQTDADASLAISNAAQLATVRTGKYVKISDTRTKNTPPQTSGATTWNKRDLNTIDSNAGSLALLSSNNVTLQAGVYRVHASATAYDCILHRLALVDVDANTVKLLGVTYRTGENLTETAHLTGVLTVTSVIKTFALYHYTQLATAMGVPCNVVYNANDQAEVYAILEFEKLD